MPFQTSINVTQAPGVPGDFATANPRRSTPAGSGAYVAGNNGLTVGLFAWADTATNTILSNTGTGVPTGFVHRELQALIVNYLGEYSMTIPAGMGVGSLFSGGDFMVKNAGAGAATVGMKAFANTTNGTISFAAAGATVAGSVETKWYCTGFPSGGTGAAGEIVFMSDII